MGERNGTRKKRKVGEQEDIEADKRKQRRQTMVK